MICSSQKPIKDVFKISSKGSEELSSLWIESVEELVSYVAAIQQSDKTLDQFPDLYALVGEAENSGSKVFATELSKYSKTCRPGGGLGCLVPSSISNCFANNGYVPRNKGKSLFSFADSSPLPANVNLINKLFPVRNQRQRGTCVAFASTALREFLLDCKIDLSEQFLYWACKQLDGIPDVAGTYVNTAMTALGVKGICEADIWKYYPEDIPGNEGQDPPPPNSEANAVKYIMENNRTVAHYKVEHYKRVLAGTDQVQGMPVVVAVLVFNSWFISPNTNLTGKITMPLPGEMPVGGHAMLVVGYQDDITVPGGGYFIVRNSWGKEWAEESPVAAGHAMIPYAYFEKYAMEAFTGAADDFSENKRKQTSVTDNTKDSSFESEYVRILEHAGRDMYGKKICAGTAVLSSPDSPDLMLQDTKENRAKFVKNGYVCESTHAQNKVWDGVIDNLADKLSADWDKAQALCDEFSGALKSNIYECKSQPLPDINLPGWYKLLAWMPKVNSIREHSLSMQLVNKIIDSISIPDNVKVPDSVRKELTRTNSLRVYSLAGLKVKINVVVSFITPVNLSMDGAEIIPASHSWVNIIQDVFDEWNRTNSAAAYTFYSLASYSGWSNEVKGNAGGESWKIFSSFDNGEWQVRTPQSFNPCFYTRVFLYQLLPETSSQRMSRIVEYIDEYGLEGDGGNLYIEKVAQLSNIPDDLVKATFDRMQKSDQYECYRTIGGKVAIRKIKDSGRKSSSINLSPEPGFIRHHLISYIATFITVAAWIIGGYFSKGSLLIGGLIVSSVIIYIAKCVETTITRSIK